MTAKAAAVSAFDRMIASRWAQHYFFIPQIFAFLIAAPVAWMAFDREPPLTLYNGRIVPPAVIAGQTVEVMWRAKFSGRDCPGLTQRELVDSKSNIWPKVLRGRRGVFVPDSPGSSTGTVKTPPLEVPRQMAAGRARYKVTQFYYCNVLQRWLAWPIVQASPEITFEVEKP
ncbi:MAG: hypothetical protein KGL39_31330 [Patescibacteria group bacterium]|nr:hypothetical protein [Patescibacteria group bacterium]